MLKVFICKIGSSPLPFFMNDNSTIQDLLTSAQITLSTGEVVKSSTTEETCVLGDLLQNEENYVIVREMKNA